MRRGSYSFPALEQKLLNNEAIQSLDPLTFDDKIQILHVLNTSGETSEIIQLLYRLLPVPDALDKFTYEESIAAMRDLGIFIGILKKHGIEPVEVIPELEYVLLVLMVKTDLPPRDTLLHYTVWNPEGRRMRTYTGFPDERSLIESVKIAMPPLIESIIQLRDLLRRRIFHDEEFKFACAEIQGRMEGMVKGVVHAKRNVSPAVFANELRFYYDPIKIDYNKDYIGPGAVEMPMFVFDHLLWSCDCTDPVYNKFKEGYLPYNLRFIREIYDEFRSKPSLVTQVLATLKQKPGVEQVKAAQSVLNLCTVLKSFRMPHKKLAESAYAQSDDHHRTKGSGGYATNILDHILRLQNEQIGALQSEVASKIER